MEVKVAANDHWTKNWLEPRRLLIAAAIFHLFVTAGIFALGRYGVVPGTIDENGILAFASDGTKIRLEAIQLTDKLMSNGIRDWLNASSPFHVKLHSIAFAILGPLFGSNIISAELFNLVSYLAILALTFHLGREVFNRRVGLVSAAVVAVWPSFLLHTTQLLRDPLFVAGMLAFILVNVRLISRDCPWRSALLSAVAGAFAAVVVWLARDSMREVLFATALLPLVLWVVRQLARKWFSVESDLGTRGWRAGVPSLIGIALLIGLTVGVTRIIPKFNRSPGSEFVVAGASQDSVWRNERRKKRDRLLDQPTPSRNPWSRFVSRIGKLRQGFVLEFSDAGSNIDSHVQIESSADLIRYLPRATVVGFFAPFPNMWLTAGTRVSRGGRLLSGAEMLATYLIEVFAIIGLWSGRRRESAWFLGLVTIMGVLSLGFVVINIGALYRLRYVFVILLIILASEGARFMFELIKKRKLPGGKLQTGQL